MMLGINYSGFESSSLCPFFCSTQPRQHYFSPHSDITVCLNYLYSTLSEACLFFSFESMSGRATDAPCCCHLLWSHGAKLKRPKSFFFKSSICILFCRHARSQVQLANASRPTSPFCAHLFRCFTSHKSYQVV